MSDKALTVSVSQGRTAQQHDRRDYTPKNGARVLEPNNIHVVQVDDEVAAFNEHEGRVKAHRLAIVEAEALAAMGDGLHEHRVLRKSTPHVTDVRARLNEQQRMVDALTEIKSGPVSSWGDRQLSK